MNELLLRKYCEWDNTQKVEKLLSQEIDIDLAYEDGLFFQLAVRNKNSKILETLLNHYQRTKLQANIDTITYKNSLILIKEILHKVLENNEVSPEIQKIAEDYIFEEDESENESEIEVETKEIFSKNYPFAYKSIQKSAELISNTAKDIFKVPKINLPPDLSDKPATYKALRKFQKTIQKIQPQVQQNINNLYSAQKSSEEEFNLELLKRELERCQFSLNLFIKDLEVESPELLDIYSTNMSIMAISENIRYLTDTRIVEEESMVYKFKPEKTEKISTKSELLRPEVSNADNPILIKDSYIGTTEEDLSLSHMGATDNSLDTAT